MERLPLTWRLMRAYGLTTLPHARVVAPEPAAETDIARYHTREYLDVLKRADTGLDPADGALYGLGLGDNPVFRGLWEVAQLVAAGSLTAADLVASGQVDRAFHFAGGLHHAFPDRASGFCYVNDAVLAILRLREHGLRVAYVDIDAHHGDGVQHAFYADPSVMTISTHERGERLFPGTGFVREKGEGAGVGFSVNLPLEAYTDTAVYLPAFEAVVPPLIERFKPDVIVAQLGADAHRTDPLTHQPLEVVHHQIDLGIRGQVGLRLVAELAWPMHVRRQQSAAARRLEVGVMRGDQHRLRGAQAEQAGRAQVGLGFRLVGVVQLAREVHVPGQPRVLGHVRQQ